MPQLQRRGAERGSPCPAALPRPKGQLGAQGAPGTHGGSGLQTPSSPSPLPRLTSQLEVDGTNPRARVAPWELPRLAPQVLRFNGSPLGGGEMGAFTLHHPQGMLSLPEVVQGSLYPVLRATFPPLIPSLGAVIWGRGMEEAEQSRAARPCRALPVTALCSAPAGPGPPAPGGAS